MDKYSKVELLALIKAYNKRNCDKIKNVDKLKKNEIIGICKQYHIVPSVDTDIPCNTDLNYVSKADLKKDVEIYFLKCNKEVPANIFTMKKKELVEFMECNNIVHHTSDMLKQETEKYQHIQLMKTIIVYNIMKYDDIDVTEITADNLEKYVIDNDLDCNIEDLQQHSILLHTLYNAYEEFCKNTGRNADFDKIKSFPKILQKLQGLTVR
jgi:hypothetical protein